MFESHAQSPFGLNKLSARLDRSRVMSGKVKQKSSATAADSSTQSINEKILKECHTLYIDPDNGELIFLILQGEVVWILPVQFHKGMGRWISVISFIYSRLGTFHILGQLPIKLYSSCFIFYLKNIRQSLSNEILTWRFLSMTCSKIRMTRLACSKYNPVWSIQTGLRDFFLYSLVVIPSDRISTFYLTTSWQTIKKEIFFSCIEQEQW